jgi:predicted nucleic acid-binding protein
VLTDTSVWIEHLRRGSVMLTDHLTRGDVWSHPFVIGELACGRLTRRAEILHLLAALPQAPVLDHLEVLAFVDAQELAGRGIGWIDAHLLASARLARIPLWTLDRRLAAAARRLSLDAGPRLTR